MKIGLLVVVCSAVIVSLASTAFAEVIGSSTLVVNELNQIFGLGTDSATCFSISPDAVSPRVWLFNGSGGNGIDTFGNAGRTFWASSNNDDPNYSEFVRQLTDDSPSLFEIWILGSSGGSGWVVPIKNEVGSDFVDLHGYTIERIGLTVDSATHTADPVYQDIYSWQITCTIEGTPAVEGTSSVPEPSSLTTLCGLLLSGGIGASMRKRVSYRKKEIQ